MDCIANASITRIYSATNTEQQLTLINEYQHPESRLKGIDLSSDRAGTFAGSGAPTGERVGHNSLKQIEADHFAHELAKKLESGRVKQQYQAVLIYASPGFHGKLLKHLGKETQRMTKNIQKDYTKKPET